MFGQGSARIRTTEFFGVVLPGLYVVLYAFLPLLAFQEVATPCRLASTLKDLAALWPPILVLLLFVSYLIGSVFRSKKMRGTDNYCFNMFHVDRKGEKEKSEETRQFPYVESLRSAKRAIVQAFSDDDRLRLKLSVGNNVPDDEKVETPEAFEKELRAHVPPFGLSIDEWTIAKSKDSGPWRNAREPDWWEGEPIYGLWKARLCVESPAGFEFVQFAEARTRFFSGMMWAARWSITVVLGISGVLRIHQLERTEGPEGWVPLLVVMLLACALPVLSHGLRKARKPNKAQNGATASDEDTGGPTQPALRWWRRVVWLRVWTEALGAAILLAWRPEAVGMGSIVTRGVLAVALVVPSAFLFRFLGRRLRNVRNGELRAAYLNYCALTLFSPRT